MKLFASILAAIAFACPSIAFCQSSPGLTYGQVPTAGQWNGYFASKQDVLGYTPLNQAGGTMTGPLKTSASTTSAAGFSVLPGVGPNVPNNGDIWLTSSGLYYRANNITFGPVGAGTITGPGTTTVGNVAKWGNTSGTSLVDGGPLGTAATQNTGTSGANVPLLNGGNTWSGNQTFTGSNAIVIDLPDTSGKQIRYNSAGLVKWSALAQATSHNYAVQRYDASGAFLDTPFTINWSNGITTVSNGLGLGTNAAITFTGTGAATTRSNLGAAASGANSDITSLSGLTTALSVAQGGTGGNTQATARTGLGLGSIATQAASAAAITGGSIDGTTVGATTASTGRFTTLAATSTITPSSTSGIVGTTTNDNANAGSIGEYNTFQSSGTALTSNTPANATSQSLTAGDWDVQCTVRFNPAAGTTYSSVLAGVNTTSATNPGFTAYTLLNAALTTGQQQVISSPVTRVSLASTTTVYCIATSIFGTSTMTADGSLRYRRAR